MNKIKLIWQSLVYSLGVAVYVLAVSFLITNGEKLFGQINGIWGPTLMLMLLCLSAAIVGSLIFGRPAYLIVTGEKQQGIKLLLFNLLWLAIITILAFASFALFAPNYVRH
jgi:hypothetical protein